MKKLMLLGATATMLFLACSKDKDKDNGPATVAYNGNTLTAAVKVNHGSVVKGDMPAATNDATAPKLSAYMTEETYAAIAGRYIVVPIIVEQGTMKGAYAQFDGADSYINIDFTKPINGRQALPEGITARGPVSDSGIVIKLPADIKDNVLKLTIAIYDASGKTSSKLSFPVTILNTAANKDAQAVAGKWYPVREKDTFNVWHDNVHNYVSNYWFTCNNGKPYTTSDSLTAGNWKAKGNSRTDIDRWRSLNADGSGADYNKYTRVEVVLETSACGALLYKTDTYENNYELGWSYNPKTKKLIRVYDFVSNGHPESYFVDEEDAYLENGKLYAFDGYYLTEYVKK